MFCGYHGPNRDFPPEHWVPDWLNRELFPAYAQGATHSRLGHEPWVKAKFELTVRHVCANCNHGWMSDMETAVKPWAMALILGTGGRPPATESEQLLLATYCFLKALSLELGRPKDQLPTYPAILYRGTKEHQTPPLGCSIAIGARTPIPAGSPIYVWFQSQAIPYETVRPRVSSTAEGYHTTLLIGHLVIDVAGVLVAAQADMDHGERFVKLWPALPGKSIVWPPAELFTGVGPDGLV